MQEKKKLRVAVIQDSPVIMDKENTLVKVEKLAGRASEEGAELILFPEAFIPCWLMSSPGTILRARKTARRCSRREIL